jgi:mannosylglycerate hydrolase
VRLSYFFDKLFEVMKDDDFKYFMLDGQMVMIEDYLHLHPENKEKIQNLVKQGKLIIGPWYSQPDEFTPDGESLIRNLLLGINMAKEYGDYMSVGYLPDSFGHSGQMPHILNGFKINSACVMRGVPLQKLNKTEFIWEGINGEKVFTVALPLGYSNGMFLPESMSGIKMRIKETSDKLAKLGNTEYVLIMNGVDHQFPQPQVGKFIENENAEYIHSTLEKYNFDARKDEDRLTNVIGELISPVTNRVHTSIASSRMYQKKENRLMEFLLENKVEPIAAMAWVSGAEYPKQIINAAWKELLKNQIHDSICGCCTDEVHREIDQRFTNIKNISNTLINMYSRAYAKTSSDEDLSLIVFNDSMIKTNQIVYATIYCDSDDFILQDTSGNEISYVIEDIEKIDAASLSIWSLYLDTPCIVNKFNILFELNFDFNYGYKKLKIIEGVAPKTDCNFVSLNSRKMENEFSIITLNNDGTFDLYDKNCKRIFSNLNIIEDCADAGDTYDFSPVENDLVLDNSSVRNCQINIKQAFNQSIAEIAYDLFLPESLETDNLSRSDKLIKQNVKSQIILYKNLKRIDIKTTIQNNVKNHRMRAVFPTGITSNHSFAEIQFGTIKRNNKIEDQQNWKVNHWAEKPLPIYSQHKFVDINDGEIGLTVMNRGLTEYEIYANKENAIAITLFRGVEYLGKPNLSIRPGRPSGIQIPTPDAECLGEVISEYSVLVHTGDVDKAKIANVACAYHSKLSSTQNTIKLTEINRKLGKNLELFDIERLQDSISEKLHNIQKTDFDFITLDSDLLIISAIKKAENEDAIILRVYNPTEMIVEPVKVHIKAEIDKVFECDFLENTNVSLNSSKDFFVTETIKKYSAQTYKITLKVLKGITW